MNNNLRFYDTFIIKEYNPKEEFYSFSSIDNELECFRKFSSGGQNPYCPIVLKMDSTTYIIERFSFDLGTHSQLNVEHVKRMLFTITFEEFSVQLDEILKWLRETGIKHRDFNPSNLIFNEKDRRIKLIDFYFSITDGISVRTPGQLNWIYTDDVTAAERIKREVKTIYDSLCEACKVQLTPIIDNIGITYYDGSSVHKGVLYHPADVSCIRSTPCVVDNKLQLNSIMNNITCNPKSFIDVGASVGMQSFSLMRNYRIDKAYMYEADPHVNSFLIKIKEIFNLKEMEIKNLIVPDTIFPPVDIVVCTNIHMWLWKQFGQENTNKIMSNLINNCAEMFFQTAGKESKGMFNVDTDEFSNKETIERYLYRIGAKEVYYLKEIPIHGGIRHLFKVKGAIANDFNYHACHGQS